MAIDSDYDRLEEMKDEEIALSVIHGAVSNAEHEQMAALIRKKSRLVLALGSCASYGGMMNLADLRSRKNILRNPHRESPKADAADRIRSLRPETRLATKNEAGKARPDTSHEDGERVCALHEIIKVDYILPGCPPPSSLISDFFFAGQENTFPPKGTILSLGKALCSVCPRARIKPARMEISGFKRIHEIERRRKLLSGTGYPLHGAGHSIRMRRGLHPDQPPLSWMFRRGRRRSRCRS